MASYSFLNVQATIAGPGGSFQLGNGAGAAEEGITVSMTEDKDTMTPGADGSVMHSLHAAKTGRVTVRLLKTSPVNQQLSLMYSLQTASSGLHGSNVIVISDTERGDVIACRQVAFAKLPDLTFAKDGGFNEWSFNAGEIDMGLGSGSPTA